MNFFDKDGHIQADIMSDILPKAHKAVKKIADTDKYYFEQDYEQDFDLVKSNDRESAKLTNMN